MSNQRRDQRSALRAGLDFEHLTLGLLLVALSARILQFPAQNDTWWHLRAGDEMLSGRWPFTEHWSYTADGRFWPDHEWLSQVVYAVVHRIGGMPLLTACSGAVVVATFVVVLRLMRGPALRKVVLVTLTAPATLITAAVRPQVVTPLLVLVVMTCLVRRRWWWLPPVFLLWANLHGGVVLGGAVVVGAWLAALLVDRATWRSLTLPMLASGVATMCTPLGFRLLDLVVTTGGQTHIIEWRPAWEAMPAGAIAGAVALLAVGSVVALRRQITWTEAVFVAAPAVLLVPAVRYGRVVPAFTLAALPLLSAGWKRTVPVRERPSQPSPAHTAILGVAGVAAAAWVVSAWAGPAAGLDWHPVSPAAAAAVRDCPGHLYNTFDDGGYLAWFVPDVPVFVDSRVDPYPDDFLDAHFEDEGRGDYAATFRRWDITCAFLPLKSPTRRALLDAGWHATFDDGRWTVLRP